MKRKLAIALTVGLAAVALPACGPEEGSSGAKPSETPSASEEPTDEPTEEPSESGSESEDPGDGGSDATLTPAGDELSIGDSATVKTKEGAVVKLTITEIEEGTKAHLDQLRVDKDTSTLTPFFVHMTAEVVSGNAENYDPAMDITGLIDENPATQLIKFSAFEPCENNGFDPDVAEGDTVESCTIQIADKGSTVDGAAFTSSDTEYDKFDGQPVTWR